MSDEEVDQPLRKYESRTVLVETPQMPQNSSLPSSARTLNDTLKGESQLAESIVDYDPRLEFCENFESIAEPQVVWNFGIVEDEDPIEFLNLTPADTPVPPPRPSLSQMSAPEDPFEISVSESELTKPTELTTKPFIKLTVDWM